MVKIMAVVNLTPDSFWAPSRTDAAGAGSRISELRSQGADIIDLGAVSTRPGAAAVDVEEEWRRLRPALKHVAGTPFSVDTTRAEIVHRVYDEAGPFIVNDISAGEDDPGILPLAGRLGIEYVAMHKRGSPVTMDALCDYPGGVVETLAAYFRDFGLRAADAGISSWILDPGLGFAKTPAQCIEIIERLGELRVLGRPILIGAADKRFTGGDSEKYHRMAVANGADILRVHDVVAARRSCGNP